MASPMTSPTSAGDSPSQELSWFGKLPSAGDFISRRMPYAVQQFWDRWCADGMDALKAGTPTSGLAVWGSTPKWAFVLPAQPGVRMGQLGVFSPSCDRVGRVFPFVVCVPVIEGQHGPLLDRAGMLGLAWAQVVAQAQEERLGIDTVDASLQTVLAETLAADPPAQDDDDESTLPRGISPSTMPWPDLRHSFDLHGSQSNWWSVPPAGTGFQSRVHTGSLKSSHFLDLCR